MAYAVRDPKTVEIEHSCAVTVNDKGDVTDRTYTLTFKNTGTSNVSIAVALTEYGVSKNIKFVVVGGSKNSLDNNEDKQTITVSAQGTSSGTQ